MPDKCKVKYQSSSLTRVARYGSAVLAVFVVTALIHLVPNADHIANISLLYLIAVIAVAYRFGRVAGVLASILAVLAFDWFFVEPRYTWAANQPAEWLTLTTFLLTALLISHLTQNLHHHAEEARQRESETRALAQASWAVASQVSSERALAEVLTQLLGVARSEGAAILQMHGDSVEVVACQCTPGVLFPNFNAPAQKTALKSVVSQFDSVSGAHFGLLHADREIYLPLPIDTRLLGVLYLSRRAEEMLLPPERRVVEALAHHAVVVLERHRLSQAEAEAEALAEADKLKTALLSMISHDFRSPLAAIKASVTGLLQDDVPWDLAMQKELLQGIDHETDRLNRMVGDILALSRLEADAWRPQCEMVQVSEVIGAALDTLGTEQNARIRVRMEARLPEASLDSVQIVQVLHNLLENALKYSAPESLVDLDVKLEEGHLNIAVSDRGEGLPPGEEAQIFEKFYRAVRWRESALPGSGIGLSICRGLVEAHRGQLSASNREGGGAAFLIALPLRREDELV